MRAPSGVTPITDLAHEKGNLKCAQSSESSWNKAVEVTRPVPAEPKLASNHWDRTATRRSSVMRVRSLPLI